MVEILWFLVILVCMDGSYALNRCLHRNRQGWGLKRAHIPCIHANQRFMRNYHSSKNAVLLKSSGGNIIQDALKQLTRKLLQNLESQDPMYSFKLLESLLKDQGDVSRGWKSSEIVDLIHDDSVLNSVVRIYCTHSEPNFHMPWQRKKQEFSTSSGFIIGGRRILTNAHAVEYGSLIQVKKRQSETKYLARVVAVGHECDLAVLEVQDASFWTDDMNELSFGDLPELLEDVSVVGYPIGGDSLSITSGVVSRIEMQEYAQASVDLLAIQIDAAINPGNSGGPVFNERNQVIGVAFQSLSNEDTENIGYVVPVSVIRHFLETIRRSATSPMYAVCSLGCRLQSLESSALRNFLHMSYMDSGVRIMGIAPLAPANQSLRINDVILSVDGIRIGNDGTIPFRSDRHRRERIHMNYYFSQKFYGDNVHLQILRKGEKLNVSVPVWVNQPLIPRNLLMSPATSASHAAMASGRTPSYLIVGGLVFLTLTREYMDSEFKLKHMSEFDMWRDEFHLLAQSSKTKTSPEEEIVILSEVLGHECNVGYGHYRNLRVVACNSIPIQNLRHLKDLVDSAAQNVPVNSTVGLTEPIPLISFTCHGGAVMVLNVTEVLATESHICQTHFIPSPFSPDLASSIQQPCTRSG